MPTPTTMSRTVHAPCLQARGNRREDQEEGATTAPLPRPPKPSTGALRSDQGRARDGRSSQGGGWAGAKHRARTVPVPNRGHEEGGWCRADCNVTCVL